MRIEFDPTNPDEAAAVRAMLTALGPTAPRYDPTAQPATLRFEDTIIQNGETQASEDVPDTNEYPNPTLDSTGTAWDARIHSTPPTTNKDGTWRAKRGVTAEQIAQVRAEREHDANLTASDAELIEQAQPVTLAEETVEDHIAEVAQIVSSAPPAPPAPAGQSEAPPAPPAPTVEAHPLGHTPAPSAPVVPSTPSFLDVMKAITAAQKDGKIDTAKVKELCAAVGAGESTMGLNGPDNGDKRGQFMALLAEETK